LHKKVPLDEFATFAEVTTPSDKMRRIEEANKFELARSTKALVARALTDEMIEGGDVRFWHLADIPEHSTDVCFRG
jgi:hypothetical protein